jgi:hypothetical protein
MNRQNIPNITGGTNPNGTFIKKSAWKSLLEQFEKDKVIKNDDMENFINN